MVVEQRGYYQMPTVSGDRIVFVCEDDLWEVPAQGGRAFRLTNSVAALSYPVFSPDGELLAFLGSEEGSQDIYLMHSMGGPITRLTYQNQGTHAMHVIGWSDDGQSIRFASRAQSAHRQQYLFEVNIHTRRVSQLAFGEGVWLDQNTSHDDTRHVIGRYAHDLATWKRYRGGLAGQIWIEDHEGQWSLLLEDQKAGCVRPMWIEDRIYFVSDMDGHANIYSCTADGLEVTRHTDHKGFYVRFAQTDDECIVYSCGAELYRFDVASGQSYRVDVEFYSARTQSRRKFVDPADYLESYALHPDGHYACITTRGKIYYFGLWDGAVYQLGEPQGVRYRFADYIGDGDKIIAISDENVHTGYERLQIFDLKTQGSRFLSDGDSDFGRITEMVVAPDGSKLALANHRQELWIVGLGDDAKSTQICVSKHGRIEEFCWSFDGRWLAYILPGVTETSTLMLYNVDTQEHTPLTSGEFMESSPAFDPEGRYIYFVSYRTFDPVYGNLFFELGLQRGQSLCLITLREDVKAPLLKSPKPFDDDDDDEDEDDEENSSEENKASSEEGSSEEEEETLEIDLDGIEQRIVQLRMKEQNILHVEATDERLYFLTTTPQGGITEEEDSGSNNVLRYWSLEERKFKVFQRQVSGFTLSSRQKALMLWSDEQLRVFSASASPPDDEDDELEEYSRQSGWVDLSRVQVEVDPSMEWRQMFAEVWRLMRDDFWREDMSGVNWHEVYERYLPLVSRVGCRGEFSELIWMMQGELGTSHAYEYGGDYREGPAYIQGYLGATYLWDPTVKRGPKSKAQGGCRIQDILQGDNWSQSEGSPLSMPGLGVHEGDVLLAVDGQQIDETTSVDELLLNKAKREVELTLYTPGDEEVRRVTVKTLSSERALYYRQWVNQCREFVDELSDGKVGYLHIPDMGPLGYAEFHRGYASQRGRQALIVDVRYNGGGHISQLILEKLRRWPLGYEVSRHGAPVAYPMEGPGGPLVALTNAYAGSDGDIFSHGFKMMELGPLIGVRTWGGVVGIWPRHSLVDGSVTTQPSFNSWFSDVGFGLENHGAEPDIEVHQTPAEQAEGDDVQLEAAVKEALRLVESQSSWRVPKSFAPYPDLSPPEELSNDTE